MARIEKTVFISYRRKDISWALAVYQYLTSQKYDVFFDYTSIPSGDFEQIIVSNIKARAHFVLILTPTALDRCSNPGDWLRREIEIAIDEKRNIIPLFFDGFNFGSPSVAEKLTGKLANLNRYNGLDIPSGYFLEAMGRLRNRYLKTPLNAVIHPVPTEVRRKIREEKVAADKALLEQKSEIKELIKPVQEKIEKQHPDEGLPVQLFARWKDLIEGTSSWFKKINPRPFGIGVGVLLLSALGIFGINSLIQNVGARETPSPAQTRDATVEFTKTPTKPIPTSIATILTFTPTWDAIVEFTKTPTKPIPTSTATIPSFTPTPALGIGSTMTGVDGMTLLYVPAGIFTMGITAEDGLTQCQIQFRDNKFASCTGLNFKHEGPPHDVNLDAFWIDKTPVTNKMYELCVTAGVCKEPTSKVSNTRPNYYGNNYMDNHPVIYVNWNMAKTYCEWTGRQLPTEAQWEKAARGTDSRMYPWGNDPPNTSLLNHNGIVGDTTEVGRYPNASPYGALDMAGNVWEWVADWYSATYYTFSPTSNPLGPASGQFRVLRGGLWVGFQNAGFAYSANRWAENVATTKDYIGFRCAMDAK